MSRLGRNAVFLFVISSISCWSQPPTPGPAVIGQNQQNHAPGKEAARTPDQNIPAQPSVVFNQTIPAIAATTKQEQTNESKWPSVTDWIIAIFTVALAVTSFFQWRAISKQAKIMSEGLIETKKSSDAAWESAEAAKDATKLTRETFVLSQRPRIVVRNVAVDDLKPFYDPGDVSIKGSFFIANAGATKAHVVAIHCAVLRGRLPMIPPHAGSGAFAERSVDIQLPPGKGTTYLFESGLAGARPFEPGSSTSSYEQRAAIRSPSNEIHVVGRVTYKDDLGTVRSTAFCRWWNPSLERFFPIEDPDYEHAE